jgi:glycosyltransferase involved in cell wall biosynthesis
VNYPKTAYILLWFPKPSETFVFREVMNLWKFGLPLKVFTLYGEITQGLSEEMASVSDRVERLGISHAKSIHRHFLYWWKRDRRLTAEVLGTLSFDRWSGPEKTGENLWAFFCGFALARRFEEEGIEHIHAPWASGPATAAWTASRLTGIPFSFTGRAWDIFTRDEGLPDKLKAATLVRSETGYNIGYLGELLGGDTSKIHLTYNGIPLTARGESPVPMVPPYKLLALGRFVGKKGYEYLLEACGILQDEGVDLHLNLVGDGPLRSKLEKLAQKTGIRERVSFPGFLSYDRVSELFHSADIFVMPSVVYSNGDRDGIPTVIMESLMHRVPVIATDVSGIPEVIEDRVTGLLIPPRDSAAIAEAVRTMISDRDAALATAERGRSKVREQFDPERNHGKVLELYQRYFGSGGDARPARRTTT